MSIRIRVYPQHSLQNSIFDNSFRRTRRRRKQQQILFQQRLANQQLRHQLQLQRMQQRLTTQMNPYALGAAATSTRYGSSMATPYAGLSTGIYGGLYGGLYSGLGHPLFGSSLHAYQAPTLLGQVAVWPRSLFGWS